MDYRCIEQLETVRKAQDAHFKWKMTTNAIERRAMQYSFSDTGISIKTMQQPQTNFVSDFFRRLLPKKN